MGWFINIFLKYFDLQIYELIVQCAFLFLEENNLYGSRNRLWKTRFSRFLTISGYFLVSCFSHGISGSTQHQTTSKFQHSSGRDINYLQNKMTSKKIQNPVCGFSPKRSHKTTKNKKTYSKGGQEEEFGVTRRCIHPFVVARTFWHHQTPVWYTHDRNWQTSLLFYRKGLWALSPTLLFLCNLKPIK